MRTGFDLWAYNQYGPKSKQTKTPGSICHPLWGEEANDGEVIVFWGTEGWSMENMDLSISYSDAVTSKEYLI